MSGVNTLTGEGANYGGPSVRHGVSPDFADRSARPGNGLVPDGTEIVVGALVIGSVLLLASLEAGGFKTVIAASITA